MLKRNILSTTIASFFLLLAFGSVDQPQPGADEPAGTPTSGDGTSKNGQAPAAQAEVLEVPIRTLLADYENNEVGADLKYKGKYLKITGKVGDIKKDILDSIYVTIGTGKQFELPMVQAFFGDADTAKAASLSKGQTITVVGRCDGLMMNVMLKDSKFQ